MGTRKTRASGFISARGVQGRPLVISDVGEASGQGAALLALESLGLLGDLGEAPPFLGGVVGPDAGRQIRFEGAVQRQRALYERLADPGR